MGTSMLLRSNIREVIALHSIRYSSTHYTTLYYTTLLHYTLLYYTLLHYSTHSTLHTLLHYSTQCTTLLYTLDVLSLLEGGTQVAVR